jgi:hypothetical protein
MGKMILNGSSYLGGGGSGTGVAQINTINFAIEKTTSNS